MEIRQLLTFIRVVQFQSFSKAADSLGYSQSAVTIQIKNLEQDLNTHLFDRVGKRVTLTPEGERFLPYAYNIINETNNAKRALTESHELTGSLKIGTVESLCFSKLPAILNEMRRLHPKISIQIRVGSPEAVLAMMEHNEIDLVIFLRDPLTRGSHEASGEDVFRICDIHNIPVATNLASAELLIKSLDRGDLEWREMYK